MRRERRVSILFLTDIHEGVEHPVRCGSVRVGGVALNPEPEHGDPQGLTWASGNGGRETVARQW